MGKEWRMKPVHWVLAVLVVIGAGAFLSPPRRAAGMRWAPTWEAAVSESRRSGKLVLAEFYADW